MMLYDARLLRRELEECRRLEKELPSSPSGAGRSLEKHLQRRADELAKTLWEIAKFIEKIGDPELRLIFELRYFRGLTWQEIAEELPTCLTADAVRLKHRRYLAKDPGRIQGLIVGP